MNVYQDWRELLDKEKSLDSVNVSTPDHMHAPITMRAIQRGLHVYTQKPLTQTIYEARQLDQGGRRQEDRQPDGHPDPLGRGAPDDCRHHPVGGHRQSDRGPQLERKAVGRQESATGRRPTRSRKDWTGTRGSASRPSGHSSRTITIPSNWRKRLDFGTGTFGDMGCHILDPVFGALALTSPEFVRPEGDAPNEDSWGLDTQVKYTFPGTKYTAETVSLTWYNGKLRPPKEVLDKAATAKVADQGSIYIGTDGVMYSPYIGFPVLLPAEKFKDAKLPRVAGDNHYLQFVAACRGAGTTSTPFSYSGPLTELVLLGCLATRFPQTTLQWDAEKLKVTDDEKASQFVRRRYRKGWEVEGL